MAARNESIFSDWCGNLNADNAFERVSSQRHADGEDHEEDRDDDDGPSGFAGVEEDPDTEEDPPEWEMGIRRSNQAKSSRIDDLTLSDVILDPDGNITYYWLGIVTVAVIYNIGVVILRIAFQEMRDPAIEDSMFNIMDTFGDLVYLLDIFVHARISFYEDGCLVLDPNKIMDRYRKSNKFKVDIIAVFPYGAVYSLLNGISCFLPINPFLYASGDVHIMIVRMPRLLKYPAMARFFDFTDSRTRNPNIVRAFKLTLNLWMVIHWIGCVYYIVSEYEGLGSNSWVYPSGTEYSTFSRKYIRVMYWSLMTLTTIGERPPPETDLEFVFTGFTFLIGVFVFAAVVGNVGDVISNMNAARTEFQSRMDQIKSYLQHRHVDDRLQNRVKRWAEYTWKRTQSIDEPSLLQLLPDRLRTEIAINVHLETLKKVKIFEECEEGLLRELVLKLRPQVYSPGDFICRTGEIGKEMFIVNHGKVEIMVPNPQTGHRTVVATLTPGNYFGEISLLKLDEGQNRRTADVRAVGYSELLRLSRKDLMSALVEYPNAKKILEQQAKERIMKTKEMRRTSTVDDSGTHSADASPDEQTSAKKDMFLRVIKSENFRKLLATRQTEMNEMREVLDELKRFDRQTTRERLTFLQQQGDALQAELQQRNKEISILKRKIKILSRENKAKRDAAGDISSSLNFRKEIKRSPKLTRQSKERPSDIFLDESSLKCCNGDLGSVGPLPSLDHNIALQLRQVIKKTKSNSRIYHFPQCPLSKVADQCTCRSLRPSNSTPDVLKGATTSVPSLNETEDFSTSNNKDQSLSEPEYGNMLNGDAVVTVKNSKLGPPSRTQIESCVSLSQYAEKDSYVAHDLSVMESLLELEAGDLTDHTDLSSDENSDSDFDIGDIT